MDHDTASTDQGAITIAEFCRRYPVSRTKLYEEINAGRLTAKKSGRRTMIGVEEAQRWFASLPEYAPTSGEIQTAEAA